MSGYSVFWKQGKKREIAGLGTDRVQAFGTKAEAELFRRKIFSINPDLKRKIRKTNLKLKVMRL
jgi:hypothetical protein